MAIKLPDDISPGSLGGTTLVALLNVAQPSQAMAAALARFVSAGGGLFISVGDRVDATITCFSTRAGAPLLCESALTLRRRRV